METLNLLVWSEEWRRNDRRQSLLRWGFCLSVMLMMGVAARVYVSMQCNDLQRSIVSLKASLTEKRNKQAILENSLDGQNKRMKLVQKKVWLRKRFSRHEVILKKLGDILPDSAHLEMVKVRANEWSVLIVIQSDANLKDLLNKLSSLKEIAQVKVRLINFDKAQVRVLIDFEEAVTN